MSDQYHPIAFDELLNRFMAEIRENHKRLEQLEKVISPLLAREVCECTDDEAAQLLNMATAAALEIIEDDFGGIESMTVNFQTWTDRLREKCQLGDITKEEQERFDRAEDEPHLTQKGPIWCVVLKNIRASQDGVRLQSDAWSYRHDLSDIDQKDYEIIAKTRPVREL